MKSVEFILFVLVAMYLFNKLAYVKPIVKDVVNSLVIILLALIWFAVIR